MALAASPGGRVEKQRATGNDLFYLRNPYLVKFGVPVEESLYNGELPRQLTDLLVYIARDGVTTTDLFRRHGSATDVRQIMFEMSHGRPVNLSKYTFYTLATIVKIYLLKIPGGLFSKDVEEELLKVIDLSSRMMQYNAIRSAISRLSLCRQRLLTLLLGVWFRMVSHCEYNTMSSEALADSVAMCLFRNVPLTADTQQQPGNSGRNISRPAIQVLQILIDDFSVVEMLGRSNVRYFADVTVRRVSEQRGNEMCNNISSRPHNSPNDVADRSLYDRRKADQVADIEIKLTDSSPVTSMLQTWEQAQQLNSIASAPEVNHIGRSPLRASQPVTSRGKTSTSLTRSDSVRQRQLRRMYKRTSWFLEPTAKPEPVNDVMSRSFELRYTSLDAESPARFSSSRSSARSLTTSSATAVMFDFTTTADVELHHAQDFSDFN